MRLLLVVGDDRHRVVPDDLLQGRQELLRRDHGAEEVLRREERRDRSVHCLEGRRLHGVELPFPTQSNEVFARLPQPTLDRLRAEGFGVSEEELDGAAPPRFVTAWNTEPEEVDRLLPVMARS